MTINKQVIVDWVEGVKNDKQAKDGTNNYYYRNYIKGVVAKVEWLLAENERLEKENLGLNGAADWYVKLLGDAKNEKERLQQELTLLKDREKELEKDISGLYETNSKTICEQDAKIDRLKEELERERMRLAACGTAALGYFDGKCCDEYRSASLSDTQRLWENYLALKDREKALMEVVEAASGLSTKMLELMKNNKLVLDNITDPMQKLAFTFYANIAQLSSKADKVLAALKERQL